MNCLETDTRSRLSKRSMCVCLCDCLFVSRTPFDLKCMRDAHVNATRSISASFAETCYPGICTCAHLRYRRCTDMDTLPGQLTTAVPVMPGTFAPELVLTSCRSRSRQLSVVCSSIPHQSASSSEKNSSTAPRVQSDSKFRVEPQQVHTGTGFPVPLPRFPRTARPQASEARQQIRREWAIRQARQEMLKAQREKDAAANPSTRREHRDDDDDEKRLLQPVFRASPYAAEALRDRRAAKTASILFLDEGNYCRSVLAEAVFKEIIWGSALEPLVRVESASIGPTSGAALHDARVMWAAQKAGLTLYSRNMLPFNEVEDIVNYDLVLAMDRFDHEEVYREVAVFDAMNPGGGYSTRVRQLGSFAPAASKGSVFGEDISDPLYGNTGDAEERTALLAAVHQLRLSCRGLVHQLHQLHARSVQDSMTLPRAIGKFLGKADQPFLPDKPDKASKLSTSSRTRHPVWRKNNSEEPENFYTLRIVKGKRQIIKKRAVGWGYWSDINNVRLELQRWMQAHPAEDPKKLPSQLQMRQTGDNSLAFAIHKHGGYAEVVPERGLASRQPQKAPQRRSNSYWQDFEVLRQELQPFLRPITDPTNSYLTHDATDTQPSASHSPQQSHSHQLQLALQQSHDHQQEVPSQQSLSHQQQEVAFQQSHSCQQQPAPQQSHSHQQEVASQQSHSHQQQLAPQQSHSHQQEVASEQSHSCQQQLASQQSHSYQQQLAPQQSHSHQQEAASPQSHRHLQQAGSQQSHSQQQGAGKESDAKCGEADLGSPFGYRKAGLQVNRHSQLHLIGSDLGQASEHSNGHFNGHSNGHANGHADGQGLRDANGKGIHSAHQQAFQLARASRGEQSDQPNNGQGRATLNAPVNGQAGLQLNSHINGQPAEQPNTQAKGQHNGQASLQGNWHINGQAHGQANAHINGQANGSFDGQANGQANWQTSGQANGQINGPTNGQVRLRMCTQKELTWSGRMDLLNAVRLWGGFTAVANRMDVSPNMRQTGADFEVPARDSELDWIVHSNASLPAHAQSALTQLAAADWLQAQSHSRRPEGHNRSLKDLKHEILEVIEEQGWQPDHMPKSTQLQAAGRHGLCAAIRDMGGIKAIATLIGLDKGQETRGRPSQKGPHRARGRSKKNKKRKNQTVPQPFCSSLAVQPALDPPASSSLAVQSAVKSTRIQAGSTAVNSHQLAGTSAQAKKNGTAAVESKSIKAGSTAVNAQQLDSTSVQAQKTGAPTVESGLIKSGTAMVKAQQQESTSVQTRKNSPAARDASAAADLGFEDFKPAVTKHVTRHVAGDSQPAEAADGKQQAQAAVEEFELVA